MKDVESVRNIIANCVIARTLAFVDSICYSFFINEFILNNYRYLNQLLLFITNYCCLFNLFYLYKKL